MRRNNTPTETLIGEVADVTRVTSAPIAVTLLALELADLSVDELLIRLGPDVFVDESTGLRCVSADTSRCVVDEHHARLAARAAARRANEARLIAARPAPVEYVKDEHLEGLAAMGFKTGGQR